MDQETRNKLEIAARRAADNAYCPYSRFPVGAAVLTTSGQIFTGSNVENISFGLTICAERNAIHSAVAQGQRSFVCILIYTPTDQPAAPCGACRQVIREFGPNATVLSICDGSEFIALACEELLPCSFGPSTLRKSPCRQLSPTARSNCRRLCIDIDNVIARTDEVMRSVITQFTNGRVQLDYEDVKNYNYWECTDKNGNSLTKNEWQAVHEQFSQPEFLLAIEPVTGVVEHLCRLAQSFELHFATSRLASARLSTVAWLDKYAFPKHDLHFLQHGEKHVSLGDFRATIEDDLAQAEAFAEQRTTVSYVLAHPWNALKSRRPNLHRLSGWPELVDDLNALAAADH